MNHKEVVLTCSEERILPAFVHPGGVFLHLLNFGLCWIYLYHYLKEKKLILTVLNEIFCFSLTIRHLNLTTSECSFPIIIILRTLV